MTTDAVGPSPPARSRSSRRTLSAPGAYPPPRPVVRPRGRPVPPPAAAETGRRFPSHADLDGAWERGAPALARPVP
ncbi:hypothetical protein STTU_5009 [Streptomyces sp. Tu6071]|nr:hypothetical protein STTU_5009 [Streptomyces sp. Tu6071]